MRLKHNLTGLRFSHLLAQKYDAATNKWVCLCDCGQETKVNSGKLRSGWMKSCGCSRFEWSTGNSRVAEYPIWRGIIARCENPNVKAYANYGGRGIAICPRWRADFAAFLADMGPRPSPQHSVERDNTNGPYAPDNCRWATRIEQVNNRRNTRYVTYKGERMSLANAVRAAGSSAHIETVWGRIRIGWDVERALETPRTRPSSNSVERLGTYSERKKRAA